MKVAVASDHGGFDAKGIVVDALRRRGHEVEDLGCRGREAVDYPDYAEAVAARVAGGLADEGVLICTTGIGMSVAANKFPGIRAALCWTPRLAQTARTHNNANVLVLAGGVLSGDEVRGIVDAWLGAAYAGVERHQRRVRKIEAYSGLAVGLNSLCATDPEVCAAALGEARRQRETVNLIASENYASRAVREASGCVMTNKYAEGYPGQRWYSGCEFVDQAERLAIGRAKTLFGAEHANVQPHCGSAANMAVYFAALQPGDAILAMSLAHGGHLTHGHKVNFSGRLFRVASYGVSRATERIDMDEVAALAREHRPKLIVAGASAYPRHIDFPAFAAVARDVGARLMVDMAHVAGLVAGGAHPSPVPHADYVTTTTHKTLRGPRSGMILTRSAHAADVDRQVFPGLQGGPEMHTIAAKAVCLHEAMQPSFRAYAEQTVRNAAALADRLAAEGLRLVSGGTDNHLMLVDVTTIGLTGTDAAAALDRAGIIVNKNAIPFDAKGPKLASGIRIGTPAATTRGMREPEMGVLAGLIVGVLRSPGDGQVAADTLARVRELAAAFPPP
jgi:RpiB/LacA/LacB family sugar-phosphate isomerase